MPRTRNEIKKVYGIDGDNIGGVVDTYVIRNDMQALSQFSARVVAAIEEIRDTVIQGRGTIVFCAGDSVMFQGSFDNLWCEKALDLFQVLTGCTASMGVGDTATEVYLALKLAKANGGGKVVHYP